MKQRVLFVILPYVVERPKTETKVHSYAAFPYGVMSIATYCKDLADFKILDCNVDPDYHVSLQWEMQGFRPDIVGFSMMFDNSYPYLHPLLETVKGIDPDVMTVLGGAAASYSWEEIIEEQGDLLGAICYSEGEEPMRSLLSGKMHTFFSCPEAQPEISYLEDLDAVADLDYSLVNPDNYRMADAFSPYSNEYCRKFFVVTSRGCPFSCQFCANAKIHGKKMRYASIDKIIDHVQYLVDECGMDTLTIYDDQLLLNMDRAKEIFRRLYPFELRIEGPNGLSPRFIDDEMAHLMRDAGMETIYLAIENGSQYVLDNLIRKPLRLEQAFSAVRHLRKYDFFIVGFFVMGMPGETDSHRLETLHFINDIGLDWCFFNPVVPFRGSPLYDECIEKGYIEKTKLGEKVVGSYSDRDSYYIKVPGVDPGEVFDKIYQMNLDVNFHNNWRMAIGDYRTAALCFKQVLKRYSQHELARDYLKICEAKI